MEHFITVTASFPIRPSGIHEQGARALTLATILGTFAEGGS